MRIGEICFQIGFESVISEPVPRYGASRARYRGQRKKAL
jgi:hypothetical protein